MKLSEGEAFCASEGGEDGELAKPSRRDETSFGAVGAAIAAWRKSVVAARIRSCILGTSVRPTTGGLVNEGVLDRAREE
jgi:hypothetical protein